MTRDFSEYVFTYETLGKLTGLDQHTIRQHRSRGKFDPEHLESVVVYVARYAVPELQRAILDYMLDRTGTAQNMGCDAVMLRGKPRTR